jgi:hypothetical protein
MEKTMKAKFLTAGNILLLCALPIGFSSIAGEDNKIALAIKIIRDVTRKTETIDWTKANKGDLLYSGDQVRTGERSIAIIKFMDNSMLRVREKSELRIYGEQKDGTFSKTVNISRGEFTFDIQKQENEQFTFTSPTSVAAIRGTEGTMNSGENGDVITILDGLVNFLNTLSNNSVDVGAGETGISRPDGTIEVRGATQEEIDAAKKALNATRGSGNERQLNIQLKDKEGKKKELQIKYRE